MVAAMKVVVMESSSVNKATMEYGVPRTALQDRITGRVFHGTKPGPKPYLDKTEEKELAEFLQTTAEVGYGKTRKQVMNIVESTAREKGLLRKHRIRDGWFQHFIERQPQLSLRKGGSTAFVRMDAIKKQQELDNYYITLRNALTENNLIDKPGQIYNVDESGMPLDHRSPHVIARKGQRKVRYCTSGNKLQITIVVCMYQCYWPDYAAIYNF